MRQARPLLLLAALALPGFARAQEASPADDVPPAFEPLAPLVGSWKGQVAPAADRLRGWVEAHEWAWAFQEGKAVGLALAFKDSKILAKGQLRHDEKAGKFTLAAESAVGEQARYEGSYDAKTKTLVLDRLEPGPDGPERLIVRPAANKIRYTLWLERKGPGAPTFSRVLEANLGREGVKLAGGAAQAEECIVTGGTATLTVTHEGKTYPLCCSGCREQFLENPARYIAKASLRAKTDAPRPVAGGGDDFGVGGSKEPTKGQPADEKMETKPSTSKPSTPAKEKEAEEGDDEPPPPKPATSKAPTWLRLGQNLEKQGNKAAALTYYRRILKEEPAAEEAADARERITALGEKP